MGEWNQALLGSPIARRTLLRLAGGAGLLAGTGMLVACEAGDAPDTDSDGTSTEAPLGGTFTAALTTAFPDLEPTVVPYAGAIMASWYWGERLYRIDPYPPRADLLPELATGLPTEIEPTVYRIAIREGVTFHNGSPLTAEDVAFTLNWIKDPDLGSLWNQFLGFIADTRAVGTHEIELTLSSPTTLLASRLVLLPIRPKTATEPFVLEPIGSGPYRVVEAQSDTRIVLERFEEYSGDRDMSYDRLEFDIVTDANARIAGVRTGQFKMIDEVPVSAVDQLSGSEELSVEAVDSFEWSLLYFNCGRPPFNDIRARQAVMYAIDREAIKETIFSGNVEPAWAGFVSPGHSEFIEPRTLYRFDPDHARSLLADAGLGSEPVPIELLVLSDDEAVRAQGPIVEQNLRDVGFEPNLVPIQQVASNARKSEGQFDIQIAGPADWSVFSPSLEFLIRGSFTGFVVRTLAHWDEDRATEVERLVDSALSAPDEAAKEQALSEAINLIQDEVPLGPMFHGKRISAVSRQLQGFRPLPTYGVLLDGVRG